MTVATRMQPFGETIFTEISRLAVQHKAVNLGQGFPNFDGPDFVKAAAVNAINSGHNQYARMFGIPELNAILATRFEQTTGVRVEADSEVTVTSGCTEALAATFLGLINPGDEVILFEPFYDSYRACVAMAGAVARFITLRPPHFEVTEHDLRSALSPRTRAILINTPHNPTGRVFNRQELEAVSRVARERELLVFSDEVYEHLVFVGVHCSIASLEGMYERTVTLSSLGKTFSLTGWKVGWAIAPPHLTRGIRASHQFLTFATATPFQHAAAEALACPADYFDSLLTAYRARRDLLIDGLARVGLEVYPPQGTYFVLADHTAFGFDSDIAFCRHLIEDIGVAAIPPSAFYSDPQDGRTLVRFAFCKDEQTLREALRRMSRLKTVS